MLTTTVMHFHIRYAGFGAASFLKASHNLGSCLRCTVDGKEIPLVGLQALVVLNIPSYAAGAHLWGRSQQEVRIFPSGDV